MNLDRLIDLAKRTGDRLIVHDPFEEEDVVIMGVDEYEGLVMEREMRKDYRADVRDLSSDELLNQINRDIAIWRAEQEIEENRRRSFALEDEVLENLPPDPFAEDFFHRPEWHAVGDVLDERYDFDRYDIDRIDRDFGRDVEEDWEDEDDEVEDWPFSDDERRWREDEDEDEDGWGEGEGEWKTEAEPVPMKAEAVGEVREEPLPSEEPVFYEEPV